MTESSPFLNQFVQQLSKCNAVFFDMDGTLANTEPLHAEAFVLALKNKGSNFQAEELHQKYYGKTDRSVFFDLFPTSTLDDFWQMQKEKNQILIDVFNNFPQEKRSSLLVPGTKEFLASLRRKGKKLIVVSSSEEEIVDVTLKILQIELLFDGKVARNETFLNKPSPSPYLRAARLSKSRMHNHGAEAMVFEDSPSGLMSALAAGAPTIRVKAFSPSGAEEKIASISSQLLAEIDSYLPLHRAINDIQKVSSFD